MAEDNQGTLDDLISRFEQGLMLASDKQYILRLLRSLAAMRHEPPNIDDIIQRLTDHSLYTKQERNALFIEARDEIVARRQFIWVMQHLLARSISEMVDDPGSLKYPEAAVVCAELYQVIGCLADELGVFAHPDVQRALDNASGHKLVHRDLLPWPNRPLRSVTEA